MKHQERKIKISLWLMAAFVAVAPKAYSQISATTTAGAMSSAIWISGTAGWVSSATNVAPSDPTKGYRVPQYRAPKGEMKPGPLKANKFRLAGDQLIDMSVTPEIVVGKIMVVDAQMVFEWCDQDYSDDWIAAGGISAEEMKEIIKDRGQAAGKGYYVSLSPIDSVTYGPVLTVFHPQGPIVVLEYLSAISDKVMDDTDYVQRLTDAGVQALTYPGYSATWMSVLSARVLRKASAMPKSLFLKLLEDDNAFSSLISGGARIPVETFGKIPDFPPLYLKIMKKELLSFDELNELKTQIHATGGDSKKWVLFTSRFGAEVIRTMVPNFTSSGIRDAAKLIRGEENVSEYFLWSPGALKTTDLNPTYSKFLETFDFGTLILASSSAKSWAALKVYMDKYTARTAQMDLIKIQTVDDFLVAAQKVLGGALPAWRDQPMSVTYPFSKMDSVITNSGLLYNSTVTVTENNQQTTIQLPGLDQIHMLHTNLSPELQKQVDDYFATSGVRDDSSPAARLLLQKALQELTRKILDKNVQILTFDSNIATGSSGNVFYMGGLSFYMPETRVSALATLHPFVQAKTRLYQLMLEWQSALSYGFGGMSTYRLPFAAIPEFSLLTMNSVSGSLKTISVILKTWASMARDDAEFQQRCKESLSILMDTYPELKAAYPQYVLK